MIYPILLVAGILGLVIMALLGFMHAPGQGHAAHGHGHGGHGHVGHGHVNHGHLDHGHAHAGHGHGGHGHASHSHGEHAHGEHGHGEPAQSAGTSILFMLLPFLSPLNWASWAIGAGGTGVILQNCGVRDPWTAGGALAGAVLFNQLCVKPLWKVVFGFASEPAGNLDACLLQSVEAVTAFNSRGEGLVRVLIDGRSEDLLARLTEAEQRQGMRVSRGDRLMIEEIDSETNSVRVCRG